MFGHYLDMHFTNAYTFENVDTRLAHTTYVSFTNRIHYYHLCIPFRSDSPFDSQLLFS